ncbi:MAG: hypothetical protein A3C53_06155 [Omnitrophica WOR_2 bacterium RIFCSPHIGHO2_02_FULL_68_15]|nr:MAG: hypothetical protein A3C53_06155 [Omnitrophica WOR_2 bacterium RIFCSPHIGHO2_02_FULL_68_15]
MIARSRTFGPLTVGGVLLAWFLSSQTVLLPRIPAHAPWLLPLLVAWLLVIWGLVGPMWGATQALVLTAIAVDIALDTRQGWFLAVAVASFAGTALAAEAGRTVWQARERAAQAAGEQAEEEVNTLEEAEVQLTAATEALSIRLRRYVTLREVTEALSRHPNDLEALLATVTEQVLRVLDHADGVLVSLVEPPRRELVLRGVRWRRDPSPAITPKTGDLFDEWVVRQGQPLIVRDVARDFRFPRDAAGDQRPLGALIAAPLVSAQRVLGVLRAESGTAECFSPEDLRVLDIVADLAAMAIENTRLYVRTAELAITDDLTGLAVHRYFHERCDEELARARRHHAPASVLLIDLDHFKRYNDTYGHSAGDKLLRTIAQTLRRLHNPGDLIARYGGEEFAVLLRGVGREEAGRQAEATRAALAAQPIVLRQGAAAITVSIGVATFPEDGEQKDVLLQAADQRLYRAKENGRNQVCAA